MSANLNFEKPLPEFDKITSPRAASQCGSARQEQIDMTEGATRATQDKFVVPNIAFEAIRGV